MAGTAPLLNPPQDELLGQFSDTRVQLRLFRGLFANVDGFKFLLRE
jgi:hypothetical protein